MTIFAQPSDLIKRVATSVTALAQVAAPDDVGTVVTGDLLRLTIDQGDRSAFDVRDQAAADKALTNIIEALKAADEIILGELRKRYPNASTTLNSNARLQVICCDLAVCDLFFLRTDDDIIRRCKQARADLERIGKGLVLLDDVQANEINAQQAEPIYTAPETVFDSHNLKDY